MAKTRSTYPPLSEVLDRPALGAAVARAQEERDRADLRKIFLRQPGALQDEIFQNRIYQQATQPAMSPLDLVGPAGGAEDVLMSLLPYAAKGTAAGLLGMGAAYAGRGAYHEALGLTPMRVRAGVGYVGTKKLPMWEYDAHSLKTLRRMHPNSPINTIPDEVADDLQMYTKANPDAILRVDVTSGGGLHVFDLSKQARMNPVKFYKERLTKGASSATPGWRDDVPGNYDWLHQRYSMDRGYWGHRVSPKNQKTEEITAAAHARQGTANNPAGNTSLSNVQNDDPYKFIEGVRTDRTGGTLRPNDFVLAHGTTIYGPKAGKPSLLSLRAAKNIEKRSASQVKGALRWGEMEASPREMGMNAMLPINSLVQALGRRGMLNIPNEGSREFADQVLQNFPGAVTATNALSNPVGRGLLGRVVTNIRQPVGYGANAGSNAGSVWDRVKAVLTDKPGYWEEGMDIPTAGGGSGLDQFSSVVAREVPYREMFGLRPRDQLLNPPGMKPGEPGYQTWYGDIFNAPYNNRITTRNADNSLTQELDMNAANIARHIVQPVGPNMQYYPSFYPHSGMLGNYQAKPTWNKHTGLDIESVDKWDFAHNADQQVEALANATGAHAAGNALRMMPWSPSRPIASLPVVNRYQFGMDEALREGVNKVAIPQTIVHRTNFPWEEEFSPQQIENTIRHLNALKQSGVIPKFTL